MQQRRTSNHEAFKKVADHKSAETTRLLAVLASVLAVLLVLIALSPPPVILRAPTPSARCIVTPISLQMGPTYLCESQ